MCHEKDSSPVPPGLRLLKTRSRISLYELLHYKENCISTLSGYLLIRWVTLRRNESWIEEFGKTRIKLHTMHPQILISFPVEPLLGESSLLLFEGINSASPENIIVIVLKKLPSKTMLSAQIMKLHRHCISGRIDSFNFRA